jgi:hypothetical protein
MSTDDHAAALAPGSKTILAHRGVRFVTIN